MRGLRLVVAATLLAARAVAATAQPVVPEVTMALGELATHGGASGYHGWLSKRLLGLADALTTTCYQPALALTPKLAGKLILRVRMKAAAAFDRVTPGRDPFKRPNLVACVVRVVRGHTPPPRDPSEELGAEQSAADHPPPAPAFPVTFMLSLQFTAPPVLPLAAQGGGKGAPKGKPKTCGASPAGCKKTGCAAGLVCDTRQACMPSSCACNPEDGTWMCTADCGGGVCVPGSPPLGNRPAPAPAPPKPD